MTLNCWPCCGQQLQSSVALLSIVLIRVGWAGVLSAHVGEGEPPIKKMSWSSSQRATTLGDTSQPTFSRQPRGEITCGLTTFNPQAASPQQDAKVLKNGPGAHVQLTAVLHPEKATLILTWEFSNTDNLNTKDLQISVRMQVACHSLGHKVLCKLTSKKALMFYHFEESPQGKCVWVHFMVEKSLPL